MARRPDDLDTTDALDASVEDERADLAAATAAPDTTVEIEVTRTQIEQTRADMSETLDAIKDKLNPQVLMSQAKDTVSEVAANLSEQAKTTIHDVTADVVGQATTTVHAVVSDVADHAKETARGAVSGAVGGAVDEAKEVVGSAVNTAKEVVGDVVDSARETVGGAVDTAKGAGSNVIDVIKNNPWPAALIGLGTTWLFLRPRKAAPVRYDVLPPYDAEEKGSRRVGEIAGQVKEKAGQVAGQVQNTAGQAAEKIGEAAHTVKEKAGDVAGNVVGTAKGAGTSLVDVIARNPWPAAVTGLGATWLVLNNRGQKPVEPWASDYERYAPGRFGSSSGTGGENDGGGIVQPVKEKLQGAAGGLQGSFESSPLAIGVAALGIGAALGLLVPETEPENRVLGETRDRLVEKAQQTAQDLKLKAQIVAEETLDSAKQTAQQEARNQGLTAAQND